MVHPAYLILVCVSGLCFIGHSLQASQEYEIDLHLYQQNISWLTCPTDWIKIGIQCVRVFREPASFAEAETVCKSYGGHLIQVGGITLNKIIGQEVEKWTAKPVWIGFQRDRYGDFNWSNGAKGAVHDGIWLQGQPEVTNNDLEQCVSMVTQNVEGNYRWKLGGCAEKLGFVCEAEACVVGDFRCNDGRCVGKGCRCDGEPDCGDGSDEANCGEVRCGGVVVSPNIQIQSPMTGSTYPAGLNCQWLIQAPIGHKVKLQFETFDTEESYDKVTVRDGPSSLDPVLAELSGQGTSSMTFTSTTNFLLLTFVTDHNMEKSGWTVSWSYTDSSVCRTQLSADDSVGTVISPGYPDSYSGNQQCVWDILAANGQQVITLYIHDLDLASGDWLEMKDISEVRQIASYNGSIKNEVVTVFSSFVSLHLSTGLAGNGRGFNISYQTGCRIELFEGYGTLNVRAETGYQYAHNLNCSWALQETDTGEATLVFHQMDIEEQFDYIEVYESFNQSATTLLANISGQVIPDPQISNTGQFVLNFITDRRLAMQGWSASFSFGCQVEEHLPVNSNVSPSFINYMSSVTYICDKGYQLSGTSHRHCDSAGIWHTSPPTCILIYCGPAPDIRNGVLVNLTSRYYNGTAYYTCNPGYQIQGNVKVTCQEDGWTEVPECEPLICPKIPSVLYGRIFTPYNYLIHTRAEVRCNPGYRLLGYAYSECLPAGIWSHPFPQCVPIESMFCSELRITHGSVSASGPISISDSVNVTCNHGYRLSNDEAASLTCIAQEKYDHQIPYCIDINECSTGEAMCGEGHQCINTDGSYWCQCSPGYHHFEASGECEDVNECALNNGNCDHDCENTRGSYVCICNEGYRLYTDGQLIQMTNQILIHNKSCYVTCPNMSSVSGLDGADLFYSTDPAPDGSYLYPTSLWIRCPLGTILEGPIQIDCQSDGSWTSTEVKCSGGQCDDVTSLNNGHVVYEADQRTVGTSVKFSCDPGYTLEGNQHRFCQRNLIEGDKVTFVWSGSQPVCNAVDCGKPPDIRDGTWDTLLYVYGSEAVYTCNPGYKMVGKNERSCLATGTWTPNTILCVEEVCTSFDIPSNVKVAVSEAGNMVGGTSLTFSCAAEGFELTDPFPVTCGEQISEPVQSEVITSLPEIHMSILIDMMANLDTSQLEVCSPQYSRDLDNVLIEYCDVTSEDSFTVNVKTDNMLWDRGKKEIFVNKTVIVGPVDGYLATPVSRSCHNNISQNFASSNRVYQFSNTQSSCPIVKVYPSNITLTPAVTICAQGELVQYNNITSCVTVKRGIVGSTQETEGNNTSISPYKSVLTMESDSFDVIESVLMPRMWSNESDVHKSDKPQFSLFDDVNNAGNKSKQSMGTMKFSDETKMQGEQSTHPNQHNNPIGNDVIQPESENSFVEIKSANASVENITHVVKNKDSEKADGALSGSLHKQAGDIGLDTRTKHVNPEIEHVFRSQTEIAAEVSSVSSHDKDSTNFRQAEHNNIIDDSSVASNIRDMLSVSVEHQVSNAAESQSKTEIIRSTISQSVHISTKDRTFTLTKSPSQTSSHEQAVTKVGKSAYLMSSHVLKNLEQEIQYTSSSINSKINKSHGSSNVPVSIVTNTTGKVNTVSDNTSQGTNVLNKTIENDASPKDKHLDSIKLKVQSKSFVPLMPSFTDILRQDLSDTMRKTNNDQPDHNSESAHQLQPSFYSSISLPSDLKLTLTTIPSSKQIGAGQSAFEMTSVISGNSLVEDITSTNVNKQEIDKFDDEYLNMRLSLQTKDITGTISSVHLTELLNNSPSVVYDGVILSDKLAPSFSNLGTGVVDVASEIDKAQISKSTEISEDGKLVNIEHTITKYKEVNDLSILLSSEIPISLYDRSKTLPSPMISSGPSVQSTVLSPEVSRELHPVISEVQSEVPMADVTSPSSSTVSSMETYVISSEVSHEPSFTVSYMSTSMMSLYTRIANSPSQEKTQVLKKSLNPGVEGRHFGQTFKTDNGQHVETVDASQPKVYHSNESGSFSGPFLTPSCSNACSFSSVSSSDLPSSFFVRPTVSHWSASVAMDIGHTSSVTSQIRCMCENRGSSSEPPSSTLFSGTVYSFSVAVQIAIGKVTIVTSCTSRIGELLNQKTDQMINSLNMTTLCPDSPQAKLIKASGVIQVKQYMVDIWLPFYLSDPTQTLAQITVCGHTLQETLPKQLPEVVNGAVQSMPENCSVLLVIPGSNQSGELTQVCPPGYTPHQGSGECFFCGECQSTAITSTITTPSMTTTTAAATTSPASSSTTTTPTTVLPSTTTASASTTVMSTTSESATVTLETVSTEATTSTTSATTTPSLTLSSSTVSKHTPTRTLSTRSKSISTERTTSTTGATTDKATTTTTDILTSTSSSDITTVSATTATTTGTSESTSTKPTKTTTTSATTTAKITTVTTPLETTTSTKPPSTAATTSTKPPSTTTMATKPPSTAATTTATSTTAITTPGTTRDPLSQCTKEPSIEGLPQIPALNFSIMSMLVMYKGNLTSPSRSQECLDGYVAAFEAIMAEREMLLNSYPDIIKECTDKSIHIRFKSFALVNKDQMVEISFKVFTLAIVNAGNVGYKKGQQSCGVTVIMDQNISQLICLFNTNVIESMVDGCPDMMLDYGSSVNSVDFPEDCYEGWRKHETNDRLCVPEEATTSTTQATTAETSTSREATKTTATTTKATITSQTTATTTPASTKTRETTAAPTTTQQTKATQPTTAVSSSSTTTATTVPSTITTLGTTVTPAALLECYVCSKAKSNSPNCSTMFESCTQTDSVCQTEIRYSGRRLHSVSKSCETRSNCESRRNSANCNPAINSPTCYYCCNTSKCNEEVELLTFKGRRKRSLPDITGSLRWNSTIPKCIDVEPPVFTSCPSEPIFVEGHSLPTFVDIPVVMATDNSGVDPVVTIHPDNFSIPYLITKNTTLRFTAKDYSGNEKDCTIHVIVRDSSCTEDSLGSPDNGTLTCKTMGTKTVCVAKCNENHVFVRSPAQEYSCTDKYSWNPADYVPDCVPAATMQCPIWTYNVSWSVQANGPLAELSCKIKAIVSTRLENVLTSEYKDQVKVDIRQVREVKANGNINISALFSLSTPDGTVVVECSQLNLTYIASLNLTEACNAILDRPTITNRNKECPAGLILVENNQTNGVCYPCPLGTQARTQVCEPCPADSYRDNFSQTSCQSCMEGTSTGNQTGSKTSSSCKELCPTGSGQPDVWSPRCIKCPKDYYLDIFCQPCPNRACTPAEGVYYREHCQIDHCPDPCDSSPCDESGTCTSFGRTFTCKCKPGYTGTQCETWLDPCLGQPCVYGHCVPSYNDRSYTCTCYNGFTGQSCDVNIDDCLGTPCHHGGQCIDLVEAYVCNCSGTGYRGQLCQDLIDRCDHGNCLYGGTCTNTVNGYKCQCPPEYTGSFCEVENSSCTDYTCLNDGLCLGHKVCACKHGYYGDNCEKKDSPCNEDPCLNNGTCLETEIDGFTCDCAEGFHGTMCEQLIDACHDSPCNHSNTVSCESYLTQYKCWCEPGWTGPECHDVIDNCESQPCAYGGSCSNYVNYFKCQCTEGYGGSNCQDPINDCATEPCVNGGTCNDSHNSFTCTCLPGFTGITCTEELDECQSNPCMYGQCLNKINGFHCFCDEGYTGELCQTRLDPCISLPCINGGTCNISTYSYTCNCKTMYTGSNCERELTHCDSDPCVGGTCVDHPTDPDFEYMCDCDPGYTGGWCEVNLLKCNDSHCENGGKCPEDDTSNMCVCPSRYTGQYCEKEKSSNFDLMVLNMSNPLVCRTSLVKELSNLSVCVWYRLAQPTNKGTLLKLTSARNQTLLSVSGHQVTISFWPDNDDQVHRTPTHTQDGRWHHVCVTWSSQAGFFTVHLDRQRIKHGFNYGKDLMIESFQLEIGQPVNGQPYQGQITGVNIYQSIVDVSATNGRACDVPGFHGDIVSWVEFTDCASKSGNMYTPSSCPDNSCPLGLKGDSCDIHVDKEPPQVIYCPSDVVRVLDPDLLRTEVTWSDPTFTDNVGVVDIHQSHQSGQIFTFGEYIVIYTALDREMNHVSCTFKVIITPLLCQDPDPPINGIVLCDTVDDGKVCNISCVDDTEFAFVQPPARMYTCRQDGVWDPPTGRKFSFPSCARYNNPSHILQGAITLSGPECSESTKMDLTNLLLERFSQIGICDNSNCDNSVHVNCKDTGKVKRSTSAQLFNVSFNVPLSNVSLNEVGIQQQLESLDKVSDGRFQMQGVLLRLSYRCETGQVLSQLNKCVNCAKGYYYDTKLGQCELCPLGSYSTEEKQMVCIPCDQGQTTQNPGAYTADQCFVRCLPGTYLFDGECERCDVGFYQNQAGALSCIPCEPGQTTQADGSTAKTDCFYACVALGFEQAVDGSCVPCPIGMFKGTSSGFSCEPCPYGYTTQLPGATSKEECSVVRCGRGSWRTNNNTCETCPVGSYQMDEGKDSCYRCPEGFTTLEAGSLSESDCVPGVIEPCKSHDCHVTAECVSNNFTYTCQCQQGFVMNEESACVDSCIQNFCTSHGICYKDADGNPKCQCADGYYGDRCSEENSGISTAAIVGIGVGSVAFLLIVAFLILICVRIHVMQRDGDQRDFLRFPIHRSDLRSSFRVFAVAINPLAEIGTDRTPSSLLSRTRQKTRWSASALGQETREEIGSQ